MDDLFAQLDSKDAVVQQETAQVIQQVQLNQSTGTQDSVPPPSQKPKDRHRARLARKAAALVDSLSPEDPNHAAQMEKETEEERAAITKTCKQLKLHIKEINPDGHCLFSSIADQLHLLGIIPPEQASYQTTRHAASQYIFTHPDDFLPFLPSLEGEDGTGAMDTGMMSPREFEQYCASIRDTGIWGGEPEILALSRAFRVPVHVVQGTAPYVVVHEPGVVDKKGIVYISYHRRMYGLGEHYNSLRPTI